VTGASIMPPSVAAAHLEACAAALANADVSDRGEIALIVPTLARAQRQLEQVLKNLADHAVGGQTNAVQIRGETFESTELADVLIEAADAAAATADAIAEALPFLEDVEDDDTRS
jgi:hypothetical protein